MRMSKRWISYILVFSIALGILFGFEDRVVYANNSPPPKISFSGSGNVSLSNIDNQNRFRLLTVDKKLSDVEFVYQNWVYKVKKFEYIERRSYYSDKIITTTCSRQVKDRDICFDGRKSVHECEPRYNSEGVRIGETCRIVGWEPTRTCHPEYRWEYYSCEKEEGEVSYDYSHTLLPANITVNQATNTFSLPRSGTVTMERVRKHEIPVKLKFDVEGIKGLTVNGNKIDNI